MAKLNHIPLVLRTEAISPYLKLKSAHAEGPDIMDDL